MSTEVKESILQGDSFLRDGTINSSNFRDVQLIFPNAIYDLLIAMWG